MRYHSNESIFSWQRASEEHRGAERSWRCSEDVFLENYIGHRGCPPRFYFSLCVCIEQGCCFHVDFIRSWGRERFQNVLRETSAHGMSPFLCFLSFSEYVLMWFSFDFEQWLMAFSGNNRDGQYRIMWYRNRDRVCCLTAGRGLEQDMPGEEKSWIFLSRY